MTRPRLSTSCPYPKSRPERTPVLYPGSRDIRTKTRISSTSRRNVGSVPSTLREGGRDLLPVETRRREGPELFRAYFVRDRVIEGVEGFVTTEYPPVASPTSLGVSPPTPPLLPHRPGSDLPSPFGTLRPGGQDPRPDPHTDRRTTVVHDMVVGARLLSLSLMTFPLSVHKRPVDL